MARKQKLIQVQSISFRGRLAMLPDPTAPGSYKVYFSEEGFADVIPSRAAQLVLEYPNDVRIV